MAATKKINPDYYYDNLYSLYPDAKCELNYSSIYELVIAVSLSAQTTDRAVNKVTKVLFDKYPTMNDLANANLSDVEDILRVLGLYRNKAKNVIAIAKMLIDDFNGQVPETREELTKLPGVGRKTANVVISEGFRKPALAVDTHVERVSKRLGLAKKDDDVRVVEEKLTKIFPEDKWHKLHHMLIFFGRYTCKATNPNCLECPFKKDENFKCKRVVKK